MIDAFDADVLIYAAVHDHPLGRRIRALFATEPGTQAGVGSVLLLPEILAKPMRDGHTDELIALASLLSRLHLRALDTVTAEVATSLAASHRLRAADAVHLATAVLAGLIIPTPAPFSPKLQLSAVYQDVYVVVESVLGHSFVASLPHPTYRCSSALDHAVPCRSSSAPAVLWGW